MISSEHNNLSSINCKEVVNGEKCLVIGSVCSPMGDNGSYYDVVVYSCVIPTVENTDKWGNTCKWHFKWDKKKVDSIISKKDTDTISKMANKVELDKFVLDFLSDNTSFPSSLSKLVYRLLLWIKKEYHQERELNESFDNLFNWGKVIQGELK